MWVCKANMLGDGLAIPHHRWERVLLGRAGWMPGALLGSQQAFPMGACLYLHTPIHTCCMYAVCAIHEGWVQGAHPRCQHGAGAQHAGGTPGGHAAAGGAGSIRVRTCFSTPGWGDFLHLFFWGAFGWASIFNFKSCLEKKKKVKFSIKAFFVCSFCKHLMVIG